MGHLQLLQPAQCAHGSRELLQLIVVQVPAGKTSGQGGRRQAGRAASLAPGCPGVGCPAVGRRAMPAVCGGADVPLLLYTAAAGSS